MQVSVIGEKKYGSFYSLVIAAFILATMNLGVERAESASITSSEKFLSFYKEIMDAQYFPFYIILSNYV